MMRRLLGMLILALAVAGVTMLSVAGRSSAKSYVARQTTTTIRFSFSEKGHRGRERTRASGSGTLTLAEPPQESGTTYSSTSATGVIKFHRWKVVAGRVTDEDDFSMNVTSGQYKFRSVAVSLGLQGTVTRAPSTTTDLCSPGSAGAFGLGDGRVKGRPDFVGLEMCGVKLGYTNGIAGVHAVVSITKEPPTP